MPAGCRHRSFVFVLVAVVATLSVVAPAAANESTGTPIADGWIIHGATATANGQPTQHWDDVHAAAFLQSWLPASILPANVRGSLADAPPPPKNVPEYTVVISQTLNGAPGQIISKYVTNGRDVWVSLPPQDIGGGAFVSKQHWFYAPQRTMAAFEGKVKPEPVSLPTTTTLPTTKRADTAKKSSGSNDSTVWIIVGVVAAIVVVGGAIVLARLRKRVDPTSPSRPTTRRR
jgi:hypothetical protein